MSTEAPGDPAHDKAHDKARAPSRRMRQVDWLDLGLRQLAEAGPARMGIDQMCRAAGRTRGSFYHHFDDHDAFIDAMLVRWAERQTMSVIAEVEAAPPAERPGMLVLASLKMDNRLDGALRAFARTHKGAALRIADVDAARVGYLERLYRDVSGLTVGTARSLARLEYAAFIGGLVIWPNVDRVEHRAYANRFQKLARLAAASKLKFEAEDRVDDRAAHGDDRAAHGDAD
ncbi:MAG: AcrR family transcriptional regulator [Paracoccaceae bacterium]|jgi:AcrR family transcriptional regulator